MKGCGKVGNPWGESTEVFKFKCGSVVNDELYLCEECVKKGGGRTMKISEGRLILLGYICITLQVINLFVGNLILGIGFFISAVISFVISGNFAIRSRGVQEKKR